jgi:predicted NUDIX family phosphoesterase
MNPTEELVFSLPRRILQDRGLLHQGFKACGLAEIQSLGRREGRFLQRRKAELDSAWKQLIPYAVVASESELLIFQRLNKGGETRLYGLYSLGVGGHINPEPVDAEGLILQGLKRELHEELSWQASYQISDLGLLNDDSNPVGRVHYGLVYLVRVPGKNVRIRETDLLEGRFMSLAAIEALQDRMESWSRLVFQALLANPQWLQEDQAAAF